MEFNTYILIWVCLFGLCFGSFYNVVILRSLSGESIVFPPSKCPKCNHKLSPWQNIPLLSFIILKGKCFYCREKISIQYPLVELITMVLFGISFLKFGISITTPFVILWLSCLLIITVTDIKEQIIDCNIAIIMMLSGLIYAYIIHGEILSSLLGLIAGFLGFKLIELVGKYFIKTDVMGEGDKYVAASLGAIFGIYNLIIILILGLFIYAICFIPIFLYDKIKQNDIKTFISFFVFLVSLILFVLYCENYLLFMMIISALISSFNKSLSKYWMETR